MFIHDVTAKIEIIYRVFVRQFKRVVTQHLRVTKLTVKRTLEYKQTAEYCKQTAEYGKQTAEYLNKQLNIVNKQLNIVNKQLNIVNKQLKMVNK